MRILWTSVLFLVGVLSGVGQDEGNPFEATKLAEDQAAAEEEAKASGLEDLTARVRESVVVVSHLDRDGGTRGAGAGFVLSEDGLIGTCQHVIGEARRIRVRLADGTEHAATVVHAWDRKLDLAILRIEAKGLKPLELGDSDALRQGQKVAALGNPQGFEFSVVEGVVSALREFEGRPMIQLAMPIEPGNSGGPLVDMEGRVHGLVSMKSAYTENLGFAVPSNDLKRLLEKPNTVPMKNWLTIGVLNPRKWTPLMGASWRQRAGRVLVENPGKGFGGRALCLSTGKMPEVPYEIAVDVKLDDEAGAAGLAFESDGEDIHYGFYPTGGRLRLTRFEGADVFAWTILENKEMANYREGDWNSLRVRVEEKRLLCYVNGELAIESDDVGLRTGGLAGLAKFRQTVAEFRRFRVGKDLGSGPEIPEEVRGALSEVVGEFAEGDGDFDAGVGALAERPVFSAALLAEKKKALEASLKRLGEAAETVRRRSIVLRMEKEFAKDSPDAMRAALLIAELDNPDLEVQPYLEEVDRMGAELKGELKELADPMKRIERLGRWMFSENGFHGSRGDYYNRSNSYMNEVLDDREGIPVTLSLLYLELAERAGIADLVGVGLPGHFVVRFQPKGGDKDRDEKPGWRWIDVFDGGTILEEVDADAIVAAAWNPPVPKARTFEASSKREIVSRMLLNLKGNAIDLKEFGRALGYVDLLVALNPGDGSERLSRALLNVQSGREERALGDLDWLLEKEPDGIQIERIRELKSRISQGTL